MEISSENKDLNNKIESIYNWNGPYKLQKSKINPQKNTKYFHIPSDNTATASTVIP